MLAAEASAKRGTLMRSHANLPDTCFDGCSDECKRAANPLPSLRSI